MLTFWFNRIKSGLGDARLGYEEMDFAETFCTQLETRADFFIWIARNPLKSPDSDE